MARARPSLRSRLLLGAATLAIALAALLPFFSHYSVGFLFNVTEGDRAITYLSVVGIVLIAGLALSGRLDERLAGVHRTSFWVGSLALAIAGILVAYALYAPWAVTLRGLVLTPERVLLTFWIGAALLPFTLAFHLLLLPGESKGRAVLVEPGSLANDGKVIDDVRKPV